MKPVDVGDPTPESSVSLAQFKETQEVVMLFYQRDNAAVCTTAACAIRDTHEDFVPVLAFGSPHWRFLNNNCRPPSV